MRLFTDLDFTTFDLIICPGEFIQAFGAFWALVTYVCMGQYFGHYRFQGLRDQGRSLGEDTWLVLCFSVSGNLQSVLQPVS